MAVIAQDLHDRAAAIARGNPKQPQKGCYNHPLLGQARRRHAVRMRFAKG